MSRNALKKRPTPRWRRGITVCQSRGLFLNDVGTVNGLDFDRVGLPMVVACTNCTMTMAIPSQNVVVDQYNRVFCWECAGGGEPLEVSE